MVVSNKRKLAVKEKVLHVPVPSGTEAGPDPRWHVIIQHRVYRLRRLQRVTIMAFVLHYYNTGTSVVARRQIWREPWRPRRRRGSRQRENNLA